MRVKVADWIPAVLMCATLTACGGGKQEAGMALDEARLSLSSARKAGATATSSARYAEAASALSNAEVRFGEKKYDEALDAAQKARDAAREAVKEAGAKKQPVKSASRTKRRRS